MTIANLRCFGSSTIVKRRAVRHNGAVLTYAPTYEPKDVSAQGILTTVSNFTVSCVRRVLQRLQHSHPTMFYCSQMVSALPTEFQSNQPAIFLAAEFDGSLCEQALHASTRFCKHALACLQKQGGHCLCFLPPLQMCLWDIPHWSPSAMGAAALTHCAKIRGFTAQNYERLRRNKRHRESKTEKQCL